MKHIWFIVGFVLVFGGGMAACSEIAKSLNSQNPVHQGMDWVNGRARQMENDRTVANWIDAHGGDSRVRQPVSAKPTPKPGKAPSKLPAKQKGKQ